MSAATNQSLDNYPLCSLTSALKRFQAPRGAFDANGSWRQTYRVYTLAGRAPAARAVGALTLRRRAGDDGAVTLTLDYVKQLVGGSQKVAAVLNTRTDEQLSGPSRWTFEARLLAADGKDLPQTRMKRSAALKNGVITIRDPVETRSIRVAGAHTVNWCLFDAVQRLARRPGPPIAFTLIDHFDEPKGAQSLAFRKEMTVAVAGGRAVRTFAFDHVGDGIVPWVYWVDEAGRLLFVVAGLEGYVLESSVQQ